MKKIMTILSMAILTSGVAQANCIPVYQEKIAEIEAKIADKENNTHAIVKAAEEASPVTGGAAFLSGGLTGIEASKALGTSLYGIGPSSAASMGAIAVMALSVTILDSLENAGIPALRDSRNAAMASLNLLKEADGRDGNHLKHAFDLIQDAGFTNYSQNAIADRITALSEADESPFCSTEQLMNFSEILEEVKVTL